ncbi:MAG: hypothetical protein SGJ18_01160 [Pseudomonadota bacterium]|nr:hypothetical protein [Pseudomonadota bacterium]
MKTAIELMKKIFTMRFPWNLWVAVLAAVNMVGGFLYFSLPDGKLILAALMGSFVVMVAIFSKYGFVRLLGLGHVLFWTPLCAWLFRRLQSGLYASEPNLKTWVSVILIVNSLSLIIDYLDVTRYFKGEKAEI